MSVYENPDLLEHCQQALRRMLNEGLSEIKIEGELKLVLLDEAPDNTIMTIVPTEELINQMAARGCYLVG